MRARRWVRAVAGLSVLAAIGVGGALFGGPAVAQSKSSNTASDVGITPTTIRIAVIADVDNPIVPGVLQGIVDGVNGAGKYMNASGKIGGRKVQVDFIDSKLNANAARDAIIQACQQDFAVVGTAALALQTTADEVNCKDAAGKTTGLPDIGTIDVNVGQACAATSYPITPPNIDCSTIDKVPQTWRVDNGDSKYLNKANGGHLHGSFVVSSDSKSTEQTSLVLAKAANIAGIKSDHTWPVSGFAPQSAYTPIVQAMKTDNSNFGLSVQAVDGVVLEREEAQLQGFTDPKVVWECTLACYFDKTFLKAGSSVEGEYMSLTFLPFNETKSSPMTANYVKYVGKDKLGGFSNWGFTAGLLFQQAAKAAVAKGGNNALTRQNLLNELKSIHNFNGSGMVGTIDVGNRTPSSCFMLDQYKNGKFVRVYPTKQGTFDCKQSNLITFQQDILHQ
jgi:ABC-type branched-subunit amino acid transport system substrate-binding protein